MSSTEGEESVQGHGPTAPRCSDDGPASGHRAAVGADNRRTPEVLRVTVSGVDDLRLRRLVRLLSATEGIEVVGGVPSLPARGSGAALVISLHEPIHHVPTGSLVAPDIHPVPAARRPDLSPRQVDVLTAYGRSNALVEVVARDLGMTAETLKTHLRRIRAKYSAVGRAAPTRRDLYVRAIEDGFLPPPG